MAASAEEAAATAHITRLDRNIGFLKCIMNPRDQMAVQPSSALFGSSSYVQDIMYSCSYVVKAQQGPAIVVPQYWVDQPTTQSGMFMRICQEGLDNVLHFAFVPRNSYIMYDGGAGGSWGLPSPNMRGIELSNHYLGPMWNTGGTSLGNIALARWGSWRLTYGGDIAIPRLGADNGILTTPELETNFSRSRMFASWLSIEAPDVPIGNFAFTGNITCACIADSTDCSSVRNAQGQIVGSYTSASLVSQSVSSTDVFDLISLHDGVIEVLGPDYPDTYTPPRTDFTDAIEGEFEQFTISNYNANVYNFAAGSPPAGNPAVPLAAPFRGFSVCVSPWGVNFWVGQDGQGTASPGQDLPPSSHTSILTGPINETGTLDVRVSVPWAIVCAQAGNLIADNVGASLIGCFISFFAYVRNDDQVYYNLVSQQVLETKGALSTPWPGAFVSFGRDALVVSDFQTFMSNMVASPSVFEHNPRLSRKGFQDTRGGKYLCTYFTCGFSWDCAAIPLTQDVALRICAPPQVQVRARTIDRQGVTGPVHCMRYEKVSVGQNLNIKGGARVQCVATGTAAPLVKNAVMTALAAADLSIQAVLFSLYRTNPNVRRFYVLKYYQEQIIPWINSLTPAKLLETDARPGSIAAEGGASGFFNTMGHIGGALLGGVANTLLSGLGGLAGGQFGGGAYGQFGQAAAPQFGGGAYGQFGAGESAGAIRQRYQ